MDRRMRAQPAQDLRGVLPAALVDRRPARVDLGAEPAAGLRQRDGLHAESLGSHFDRCPKAHRMAVAYQRQTRWPGGEEGAERARHRRRVLADVVRPAR